MDYEKKYKEALEMARKELQTCGSTDCDAAKQIFRFFPELAESKDERIRKELLESFKYQQRESRTDKEWLNGIKLSEVVAWLEKQSDTNETINNDELAQSVLRGAAINLITWIDYNAAEGNTCLSNVQCREIENALVSGNWNKIYAYMKKKLERQDEQKHKDNPLEGILIHGNNDAYRLGYKKAIEKACEWLNNNLLHYWGQINANDTDEFIDNFKKAMEQQ